MNFIKTNRSLRTANATIYFHTHSVSPLFSQRWGKSETKTEQIQWNTKNKSLSILFVLWNRRLFYPIFGKQTTI